MKTISAAEFKARCLQILDEVDEEGIIITKRGKPVAKLVPVEKRKPDMSEFFGMFPDILNVPEKELSTAGAWKRWDPAGAWTTSD